MVALPSDDIDVTAIRERFRSLMLEEASSVMPKIVPALQVGVPAFIAGLAMREVIICIAASMDAGKPTEEQMRGLTRQMLEAIRGWKQ